MSTLQHWLYGKCEFNVLVKNETNCVECIHGKVCKLSKMELCANYEFGSSMDMRDCQPCHHKYSRWDRKQPIPCFRCFHFRRKKNVSK